MTWREYYISMPMYHNHYRIVKESAATATSRDTSSIPLSSIVINKQGEQSGKEDNQIVIVIVMMIVVMNVNMIVIVNVIVNVNVIVTEPCCIFLLNCSSSVL